jgi:hypothetical protein
MSVQHPKKIRPLSSAGFSLCLALGTTLVACGAERDDTVQEEKLSAISGELRQVIIGDPELGISRFDYFIETAPDQWTQLEVDTVPEEAVNAPVTATGYSMSDGKFLVVSLEVTEIGGGIGEVTQELISPSPKKVAVILMNFRNNPLQPIDQARARELVFTGTTSTNAYFKEISFGVRSLVGKTRADGDVFGWVTIDYDDNTGSCSYSNWGSNARTKLQAAGTDLSGYDHFVHYFPRTSLCSFSGVAQMPGQYSWINGGSSQTMSHELGHNFGVHHASSYNCTSNGVRVSTGGTCTLDEYGDPFDVMGRGYRHMNAYQKGKLGFLETVNTVTTSSGEYTVAALEQKSTGIQSLRVPIPGTTEYYYVETRQVFGFDSFRTTDPVANGVLLHRSTDYSVRVRPALIDMAPSTTSFTDAALLAGQTFTDSAAGVSITLLSRTATDARVRVGAGGTTPPPPPPTCATGEQEFNGRCYFVLTTAQTYNSAANNCSLRGSTWRLVAINDSAENQFVSGLIGTGDNWIGATDNAAEGTFVWSTGATFWTGGATGAPANGAYTNFASGEPNNQGTTGENDCVRMISDGTWRDIGCTSSYTAVCERN